MPSPPTNPKANRKVDEYLDRTSDSTDQNIEDDQATKPLYSSVAAKNNSFPEPPPSFTDLFRLPLDNKPKTFPPFQVYEPPFFQDLKSLWKVPPIILNGTRIPRPILEPQFHSASYRLHLYPDNIADIDRNLLIKQGTTIVFSDTRNLPSWFRFVVEWCQWVENHMAYLKVVGISVTGERYPYDDPQYPSFILVVPICITHVPIPPSSFHYLNISAYQESLKPSNGGPNSCKICAGST